MIIAPQKESMFWKAAEYLSYVFFLLFPFVSYTSYLYTGTSTRAVNLILLATIFEVGFAIWLLSKKNSVKIAKSPIFLSCIFYLLSLWVSALLGINFGNSFWSVATRLTGLWYFLNLGFFMVMLWELLSSPERYRKHTLVIVLSTALYSFLALLGPEGLGFFWKGYRADGFTFGNSTFAGMYLFGAFLLSLYYLFQSKKKEWWMYLLPALLVVNPSIINHSVWLGDVSGGFFGEAKASSYMFFLSLFALAFIWLVSKIKNEKIRVKISYAVFALSLIAIVFAAFSLLSPNGFLRKIYLKEATSARPLVWEISAHVIKDRPVFGWGGDNFERAFEKHYDNRLLENETGNEAWFDRAHNVFVDQVVDNGFLGLAFYALIYIVIALSLLYVALRSRLKEDRILASVLIVYFALHIGELQTAFDTTISYPLIAFMVVSAGLLFDRTRKAEGKNTEIKIPTAVQYGLAALLIAFASWSLFEGLFPFMRAQAANGTIRTIGSSEKRVPLYGALLGSKVDPHAFLWRTSTDFQRGISEDPKILDNPKAVEALKKEILILEQRYREYLKQNPTHFRAHLNLADILIYQRLFEVNKLEEAQTILDEAIKLVPESPQPYWMKAVAYIYMRKFDLAREYAKKGLALNPNVVESKSVLKYVEDSIKNFPNIDLYFFRQI